ncbi:prepilin-type N-terminal cleavage/methylation domain-containing protein [Metabacillus litoralis]|uniref:Prepilin-type N-terminal cleavage/methylation domain-containing protein n=1 Tax=Metabacillus litoralis TaxID=152268 RepID=A0A5C6VZQ5_9BACI|nr:prepilin-type N-terminal cleavage/methylation domain-containing protein [Metabacillus litoralis]TXC90109.1 prepilin-type N-terminal cleavage/methylation domain-containing protein [Metabacillus litoralis]
MKFKLAKLFTHNKGFTLIEVMLSIVIFSILTLGMLTLFSQAMTYTQKSENDTIGVYAARNMLNFIEQRDFQEMKTNYVDSLTEEGAASTFVLKSNICRQWYPENDPATLKKRELCESTFEPYINNRQFDIDVELQKHNDSALRDSLIPTKVTVKWEDDNESILEGFITNEKLR